MPRPTIIIDDGALYTPETVPPGVREKLAVNHVGLAVAYLGRATAALDALRVALPADERDAFDRMRGTLHAGQIEARQALVGLIDRLGIQPQHAPCAPLRPFNPALEAHERFVFVTAWEDVRAATRCLETAGEFAAIAALVELAQSLRRTTDDDAAKIHISAAQRDRVAAHDRPAHRRARAH